MIRRALLMVLVLAVALPPVLPAAAQDQPACSPDSGTVITRQFASAALGQTKSYNLYLPPDWCHLSDLPMLVMLHGWTGDHTDWVAQGHLDGATDTLILSGEIEPLVILMPDGDNSFYVDSAYGNYETYVIDELVPAIDAEYPTAATRESRFIGGLSMGGYGALYLGLRHPDLFSAIGAHSAALLRRTDGGPEYLYGRNQELFEERDPITIIAREGWPDDMRLFLDYGISDSLALALYDLVPVMTDLPGVEWELHLWPGVHDWDHWGGHAPDYLRFYAGIEGE